jgi:tRNA threonylcarbamoyladenosine biosynthesis protein TsaB
VALIIDDFVESEINMVVRAGHAGRLLPMIDDLLRLNRIDRRDLGLIAVGSGPGSFTGIRIGIATAKGLARATGCPLVGISTLDALAYGALPAQIPIMPVIDARKSEIFCGLYTKDGSLKTPYMNIHPHEVGDFVQDETLFIGNGIGLYEDIFASVLGNRFHKGPQSLWAPRASVIGIMALGRGVQDHPTEVNPIYVRPSDATLLLQKR